MKRLSHQKFNFYKFLGNKKFIRVRYFFPFLDKRNYSENFLINDFLLFRDQLN